jgi:hypothetical protein
LEEGFLKGWLKEMTVAVSAKLNWYQEAKLPESQTHRGLRDEIHVSSDFDLTGSRVQFFNFTLAFTMGLPDD